MTTTTVYPRATLTLDYLDADDQPVRASAVLFWDADHQTWTVTAVYADTGDAYGSAWSCPDVDTALWAWEWSTITDAGEISQHTVTITPCDDGCPECGAPITDSGTTNPCATRYTCRACGWDA
jgi:predicted RNA-binding Zn-ribbon protein involved in translation (DUF1610 family)